MTARKIGKHALIVVASVAFGFGGGFIAAMVTSPFWGWFEDKTGIESLGHSGPDDWVFDLMFAVCIPIMFIVLELVFRESKQTQPGDQKL